MALVSVRYGYVLHLAVSNGPKRDLLSIKGSYRFMVLTQRAQAHTKKIPSFFIFFVGEQSIVCSDWRTDLSMTSISHVIASCHTNPSHYKYRKSRLPLFSWLKINTCPFNSSRVSRRVLGECANVWCIKNQPILISKTLLSLVRFLMHQTLHVLG